MNQAMRIEASRIVANQNARAKRLGIEEIFTVDEWLALCERYNYTCLRCGERQVSLSPDHVIALCYKGANSIENIQPLCLACNLGKTMNIDYRQETPEIRERRWRYVARLRTETQGKGRKTTIYTRLSGHMHDEISMYLIDQDIEPTPDNIHELVYPWIQEALQGRVQKIRQIHLQNT